MVYGRTIMDHIVEQSLHHLSKVINSYYSKQIILDEFDYPKFIDLFKNCHYRSICSYAYRTLT